MNDLRDLKDLTMHDVHPYEPRNMHSYRNICMNLGRMCSYVCINLGTKRAHCVDHLPTESLVRTLKHIYEFTIRFLVPF